MNLVFVTLEEANRLEQIWSYLQVKTVTFDYFTGEIRLLNRGARYNGKFIILPLVMRFILENLMAYSGKAFFIYDLNDAADLFSPPFTSIGIIVEPN